MAITNMQVVTGYYDGLGTPSIETVVSGHLSSGWMPQGAPVLTDVYGQVAQSMVKSDNLSTTAYTVATGATPMAPDSTWNTLGNPTWIESGRYLQAYYKGDVGDIGILDSLASIGIASNTLTPKSTFNWQTYVFKNAENIAVLSSAMTGTPSQLVYASPVNLVISVVGISSNDVMLSVYPNTTSESLYTRYEVLCSGAPGSRSFNVREVVVLPGDGSVGGDKAARVRNWLDVYAKNDTFDKSLNLSDVVNKSAVRLNLDVYAKSEAVGRVMTLSDLRLLEPTIDGQVVYVSQYSTSVGIGGGAFCYDASDITSADDDGVTVVTVGGKRWKRVCTHISTDYYGLAAGSGTSVDSAVVINKALIAATNAPEAKVVVSKGAFYTNTVIKVPSSVTLCGSGVYATAIIASPSMPRTTNVIQNSKHVYQQFGTDYNEDIRIENIILDGNNRARNTTETWVDATQGTVLLLATTRKSVVSRVWVRRGIQHCLDISAGYYFNDGNINNNAVGGSYDILVEDCLGQNAQLDDVFTMHNSDMVKFIRCKAWNDDPDMVWASNQHGFEIDEGSSNVTVRDCEAVNFISGFQQKGHDTTMPARNVTFDNCTAQDCVMSFQVEHRHPSTIPVGQHQNARSSRIVNCTSVNANNSKNTSLHARAVYVDGFYGVFVNNLRVDGGSGNIYLTRGAKGVYVNGVTFDGGYGISDTTSDGLIYVETGAGCDNYHFSDIFVSDAVSVPVFRDFNTGGLNRSLRNIYANGSSSSIPMIYMVPGLIDNISGLTPHNTWACALRDAERGPGNGDYLNTVSFVSGVSTQVGSGNPNNGTTAGKAGALYIDIGTGGVAGDRYQCTDTGVNHWVKVSVQ